MSAAPSPLFPIAVRLDGLACLVVGGGPVAARKAAALLEAGALVTVVAPQTCPAMEELGVVVERRPYLDGEAASYRLVITATGVEAVDRSVFADGEAAGVFVNAADDVDGCRFYLPAVVRRGPVTVAVSTAGASPYLAGWLRDRVAEVVGPEFELVADLLAEARRSVRAAGVSTESVAWSGLVDAALVERVASGDAEGRAPAHGGLRRWGAGGRSEDPAAAGIGSAS